VSVVRRRDIITHTNDWANDLLLLKKKKEGTEHVTWQHVLFSTNGEAEHEKQNMMTVMECTVDYAPYVADEALA
jgi:hypothetical protein